MFKYEFKIKNLKPIFIIKLITDKKVLNCEAIVLWENEIYNTEVLYKKNKGNCK